MTPIWNFPKLKDSNYIFKKDTSKYITVNPQDGTLTSQQYHGMSPDT